MINVPGSKVWDALTGHAIIKQYFFGRDFTTDWRKGSPILYKYNPADKPHVDKANILDIEKEKRILFNYWSSATKHPTLPKTILIFALS